MNKRRTLHTLLILLALSLLFGGCLERKSPAGLSGVEIDPVKVHRYDQVLFDLKNESIPQGLDSIYSEYRIFLGEEYRDTLNIIRITNFLNDPVILSLKENTDRVFPDLARLEQELTDAFSHYLHHFPDQSVPVVYSYISGLYYEAPVEYFDSAMIISLDLYLGEDFEPYRAIGLPRYMTRRMRPEFITPDCMRQAGVALLPPGLPVKTLLDQMILHGKLLYYLDQVLPGMPDTLKTGYTGKQQAWCRENENQIWAFLIDNELLFSTDPFVINKFIQDGPFTSGLPEESPGMLGKWVGLQIVRSFMKNHERTSLQELMKNPDHQGILSTSRYKPSR
jgi:hypothetical protein